MVALQRQSSERRGLAHSATVWDLPSAGFLQDLQLLFWFRRILRVIAQLSGYHGVFSQMSKLPLVRELRSFLAGQTLPTAMTAVTRPKPCDKRTLLIMTLVKSYF